MNDRPLPHSDEIEQAIIGSLISDKELHQRAMEFEEADFYNPKYRKCMAVIRWVIREGLEVDIVTLTQKSPDIEGVIFDCMNHMATTAQFDSWVKQLRQLTAQRKLITGSQDFYHSLYDTDDVLKLTGTYVSELNHIMDTYQERPNRPQMLVKDAYSSGFYTFDYNDGGFQGGKRIVFKGAKNQGKTTLAKQFLFSTAKQNIPCFFFSGERDVKDEIADLAKMGASPQDIQFREGMAKRKEYYPTPKAIEDYKNGIGKYITVIDKLGAGKQKMWDYVFGKMEQCAKNGAKLFVLDNMAVLNSGSGKDKFSQQSDIIMALDVFKLKYDCDIILITHPKKGKGFESTSGMGEIENLADTVIRFIRLTDDKHIVETENYMLKSNALSSTKFPDDIKARITAIMTFEKVKKGTKFACYFIWDAERETSIEVSTMPTALEYQQQGHWVEYVNRYSVEDLPDYKGNKSLNGGKSE